MHAATTDAPTAAAATSCRASARALLYQSRAYRRLHRIRSERPELAPELDALAADLLEVVHAVASMRAD
ncbi:MAG: hypothetical protein HY908_05390 [Myxococcales bacterium]|nr:hypothetical protein [Myxococcales bacterium]